MFLQELIKALIFFNYDIFYIFFSGKFPKNNRHKKWRFHSYFSKVFLEFIEMIFCVFSFSLPATGINFDNLISWIRMGSMDKKLTFGQFLLSLLGKEKKHFKNLLKLLLEWTWNIIIESLFEMVMIGICFGWLG